MKMKLKSIIAAITAVSAIAFGSVSVSATTADDVIAAARGAGILDTYVAQLENFLLVNKFNSDQYDMMIDGLANIRNISLDVARQYFPDVQSIDDFFGGGSSSEEPATDSSSNGSSGNTPAVDKLDKNEKPLKDLAEDIQQNMSADQMLDAINEVIETGKNIGLDITVEQTGEKSFLLTAKDKDGVVKLVMPIGKLVSTTGVEAESGKDNGFMTVAAICAAVTASAGIGAYALSRKNKNGEQ
ncbi:MAG: hypothetical protein NC320_00585 [Clostridium sp.]|nr:hypothetical protein [Clostridium sp.]MCM1546839.1 hypothetical protein [Ruminococcus sp.]